MNGTCTEADAALQNSATSFGVVKISNKPGEFIILTLDEPKSAASACDDHAAIELLPQAIGATDAGALAAPLKVPAGTQTAALAPSTIRPERV